MFNDAQMRFIVTMRDQASAQMQQLSGTMKAMGSVAMQAGQAMSVGLSVPMAFATKKFEETAGGFERATNMMAANAGTTAEALKPLREQALQLAKDTTLGATKVAEAQLALVRFGQTIEEVNQTAPAVASLAIIENMDPTAASEKIGAVLSQYQLAADQSTRVADVMAQASIMSSASVTSLADSLKFTGLSAATAGVSIERTAAALTVLSKSGLDGFTAGTSLRALFTDMVAPSQIARQEMEKYGLSMKDASGRLKDLGQIVDEFKQKGVTQESLYRMFDSNAATAFMSLMTAGTEKLDEYTAQLDAAAGAADYLGQASMTGLKGAMEQLNNTFEVLLIRIGDSGMLEEFTSFAQMITMVISKLSEADLATLAWGAGLLMFLAQIGPVLMALSVMGSFLMSLTPVGWAALAAVTALGIGFGAVAINTNEAIKYQQIYSATIAGSEEISMRFKQALIELKNAHGEARIAATQHTQAEIEAQQELMKGAQAAIVAAQTKIDLLIKQAQTEHTLSQMRLDARSGMQLGTVNTETPEVKAARVEREAKIDAWWKLKKDLTAMNDQMYAALSDTKPNAVSTIPGGGAPDALAQAEKASGAMDKFADRAARAIAAVTARTAGLGQDKITQDLWNAAAQVGLDRLEGFEDQLGATAEEQQNYINTMRDKLQLERDAINADALRQGLLELDVLEEKTRIAGLSNREQAIENALLEERLRLARENNFTSLDQVGGGLLPAANQQQISDRAGKAWDLQNRQMGTMEALKKGWDDWGRKAADVGAQVYATFGSTMDGLTTTFSNFLTGQSVDWENFAFSVVSSIAKIIIQLLIMKAIMASLNFFGGGAGASAEGFTPGWASGSFKAFAQGSAFVNGIVSSPTLFKFANGGTPRIGVMGEAGPEGILPLKRMANGALGVHADGGGGSGQFVFAPKTEIHMQGSGNAETDDRAIKNLQRMVDDTLEAKMQAFYMRTQRNTGRLNSVG